MAFNDPLTISLCCLLIIIVLCFISSWYINTQFVVLTGQNEVPPNSSPGSGIMKTVLINNGTALSYEIAVTNLTSPVTASHFHLGRPGVSGPILVSIPLTRSIENGNVVYKGSGTWRFVNSESVSGESPHSIVNQLKHGHIYYNVHTVRYPNGELRGQVKV